MSSMVIDRRALLLGTLAAIGGRTNAVLAGAATRDVAFVSAAKLGNGSFAVLLLAADGTIVREVPLSARGHDIALHPQTGRAVAFARRPGTFAVGFSIDMHAEPVILTAAPDRHFYGHGAFSHDGRLLYVSENDIPGARGVIGIYDVARGYRKIGEHPSHGVGPHEIILLDDGKTLGIANGGLDTVPDYDGIDLNREAMQPSLAFVDTASGQLRAKHALAAELRQLSIRHIVADAAGLVWFGAQWEGAQSETPQLIGASGVNSAIHLIEPPIAQRVNLKGYIGSVTASADRSIIAASAPKAGRVIYVDAASGTIKATSELKDVCGIAGEHGHQFAASSGFGAVRHEVPGAQPVSEAQLADVAFDNHLRRWG